MYVEVESEQYKGLFDSTQATVFWLYAWYICGCSCGVQLTKYWSLYGADKVSSKGSTMKFLYDSLIRKYYEIVL